MPDDHRDRVPPISPLVHNPPAPPPAELPALSNRAITWAAVALGVLGVALAVALVLAFGGGGHAGRLDAIRTAATVVLGTGGAAALWLAARRQRTAELTLNQAHAAQAATVADAEARRITDLYGKAADQLGSPQAATRLAGLYALERLAQDNPGQRQVIVDLLCAYLRMPHDADRPARPGVPRPLLGRSPRQRMSARPTPPADPAAAAEARRERQVRRTAQAVLFRHLRAGSEDKRPDGFWPGMHLDLSGAVLGPANLIGLHVTAADFTGVTFTGDVWFDNARFGLDCLFTDARFTGAATFRRARFDHSARFDDAVFEQRPCFEQADFRGKAQFGRADFRAGADFTHTAFGDDAWFDDTRFDGGQVDFAKAHFARGGVFGGAIFDQNTYFTAAHFEQGAHFHRARFRGSYSIFTGAVLAAADFRAVEFGLNTDFTNARFLGNATFDHAVFTGHADFVTATFEKRVDFDTTRFDKDVTFTGSTFTGTTRIANCAFVRVAEFGDCRFGDLTVERTAFAGGAGFRGSVFSGPARFTVTDFSGVCGFPDTRFGDALVFNRVRLDCPVGFARAELAHPPQLRETWVRLDRERADLPNTWPPGTAVTDTGQRPSGVDEGKWALLVAEPGAEVRDSG